MEFKSHNVNDTYLIKKDLEDIKKILDEVDMHVEKFLGPNKIQVRAKYARNELRKLKNKLIPDLMKKIQKTKEDYIGDYS